MLKFPRESDVNKIMPKEAFYKNLNLTTDLKDKFVSDVKRIVWKHKLSPTTINIENGNIISEILVLAVELKKQELDYKIIEAIARQNIHKILFILQYADAMQLVIWYNKLYKKDWISSEDLNINIKGFNLDEVWDGFVEQIALVPECTATGAEGGVAERLARQEEILKLYKEIDKLERLARAEKQPKKKFELVNKIHLIQTSLKEITNG